MGSEWERLLSMDAHGRMLARGFVYEGKRPGDENQRMEFDCMDGFVTNMFLDCILSNMLWVPYFCAYMRCIFPLMLCYTATTR